MGLNPAILGQNRNPAGSSALDPVVTDWVARTIAASGSVANSTQTAIDNFVKGCKADGIWSVMQSGLILPLASDGFDGFTVPLIIPAGKSVTPNNFTAANYSLSTGLDFITNTTNRRISSDLIASDLMTASSSQCSAYTSLIRRTTTNSTISFEVDTNSRILLAVGRSASTASTIQAYNSTSQTTLTGLDLGFYTMNVVSSTLNTYRNNILTSRASSGTFPASAQLQIGRFGTNTAGDQNRYGYFYVGPALTAAQELQHYNLVQALQTALGRAV